MPEIISLSLATFELLWDHLALGQLPAPFEIRPVGTTDAERAELRSAMWHDLQARGLAHERRLEPRIAAMCHAIGRADESIASLAIMDDGRLVRALAAASGELATLAVQGVRNLHLAAIEPAELPLSIVDLLPAARAFPGRAVTVPDGAGFGGFLHAMHGSESDDEQAAHMLASARVRGGYFTARGRDRALSAELAWIDTDRGRFSSRYVTDPAGRRSTAHTPVGRDELVAQLAGLLRDAQ
ncbi:MAG TPA: ESX secretion-associated protein EspG [Pseudonocardiaceae bacterium]|nr:ESX secretion-associated protein EspG [Pseudonocardiaceae bacterium]